MKLRRSIVVCLSLLTAVLLWWPMHRALAPGGWTVAKATIMGSFALATLWVGFCFAQGLLGFAVLLFRTRPPASYPPPASRIAIGVTVRNEDMGAVLPPLRRLLDGLDAAGAGTRFVLFVLSDSTDTSEEPAIAAFRAADRAPDRIRYRRRTDNDRF